MCSLGSSSLSEDWTLKDRITVFCFVFLEGILCRGLKVSVKSRQRIYFLSQWDLRSIHHPCQWPNWTLAWVNTNTSAENVPWNCVAPAPLGPSALPTFVTFPHEVHWGFMSAGQLFGVDCSLLPLATFLYSCQLVNTGAWAQWCTCSYGQKKQTPIVFQIIFLHWIIYRFCRGTNYNYK